MWRHFKEAGAYNAGLPLDKQIHNEVLLILGFMAIITGFENFLVNLPLWYGIMFIIAGLIALSMLFLNYHKSWYSLSKTLTVLIMYGMTVVSWLYNGGLDGPALLFIGAIIVFSIGFYPKKYILIFTVNSATLVSLVLLNYFYPETRLNTYNNESERVVDMIISYMLLSSSLILVLSTIIKNYNKARKTIADQNSELENLNCNLKKVNEELVYINASKDKLLSIIAHDLRSPLGSLVNYSDILTENISSWDYKRIKESVCAINKTQKNTLSLLEDLLLWSKSQSGTMSVTPVLTDLKAICQSVIDEKTEPARDKNIKINNLLSNGLNIVSDRNMLKTILRNLISNAVKFTPRDGNISISSKPDGIFEVIMIKDTGIGMDIKTIENLWDIKNQKVHSGTEGESGSGLGLSLCRDFVERHGGKIWVESEAGKGSIFYFTIPRSSETPAGEDILLPRQKDIYGLSV